ncbi:bcl-2-binding component 3 [Syngnathus scovelli]|uniref:bcl-2-binding component 3 n=1 Tax=Syngnathus scovelli TaxID=161590 RepID=UPI00211069E1|nr:bcl-2-binding component 3 [Syngnathus scovelli]
MARAETMESVGEAARGASIPLPHQYSIACHSFLHNFPNNHHQSQQQPNLPTPPPSPPGHPNPVSGEQSNQRQTQAAHRRGPLPDLLPRDQRPVGGGPHPRGEATLEARPIDTTAVGLQLRTIGDQFNASVLRPHAAPHWQDWIDAGRGFLNLAARTLSALYRLT